MINTRLLLCAVLAITLLSGCDSMPSWLGGGKKKVEPLPGDRVAVLKAGPSVEPDAGLASTPFILSDAQPYTAWPQHGGNATSSLAHPAYAGAFKDAESASIGDGNAFEGAPVISPVVSDGLVYAMDASGQLSAHHADDVSKERWSVQGIANEDEDPILGGGLSYANGKVFAAGGNGVVAAFDASTGRELWRQAINIPIRSAPKSQGGRVYAVTVDNQLYALDADRGGIIWTHRGINETAGFFVSASPAATEAVVVAPYSSGEVQVIRAETGEPLWGDSLALPKRTYASGVFAGIGGDPVVAGNALYAASSAGMLAAFRLDNGQRVWEQPISSLQTLWVSGDALFALTPDMQVVALSRMDGRVKWTHQLERFEDPEDPLLVRKWFGPVLAGGKLLIVSSHGVMVALNPQDGGMVAQHEIPDDIETAPVVASNAIYLVDSSARLHVLR